PGSGRVPKSTNGDRLAKPARSCGVCYVCVELGPREACSMAHPHIALQGTGHSWESDRRLGIGRLPSCEIILDDASVSRRHAEVFYSEAGWLVRDLGSTNGTFLNGTRLGRNAQRVQCGDQL